MQPANRYYCFSLSYLIGVLYLQGSVSFCVALLHKLHHDVEESGGGMSSVGSWPSCERGWHPPRVKNELAFCHMLLCIYWNDYVFFLFILLMWWISLIDFVTVKFTFHCWNKSFSLSLFSVRASVWLTSFFLKCVVEFTSKVIWALSFLCEKMLIIDIIFLVEF